ncbi:hypothetical protein RS84_00022 [Microbacterium hydrocarbonoxydans]|uniref:Uncharacterized protein n=1 Tax=Microbacterium hydrocarbonoxydans TaxID=273678 RepID=A0A0M2HYM5_9MICO|nr:hypothetical protein [Microbacterium hydrocarbonoxydans]KJL49548.1 hypothetical protein RS84_00022 [Microbacterium hydrocarbonoxydans]
MNEHEKVKTDLTAGTLSTEDREKFLRARGLVPGTPDEKAAAIRAQWPDEDILMAMELGQF